MTSHKYSKLFFIPVTFLLFLFLLNSCKDNSSITGSNTGNPTNPGTDSVTIAITAPKNGDILTVATTFSIQWTSNTTSKVRIEYSTDNGDSWQLIGDSVANSGTYVWDPIPNQITDEGKIRITTDDNLSKNISAGAFSITKGSSKALALAKPNGGEVLYVNESFNILWVASGITSIKIELSIDNGFSWNPVILSFSALSGSYTWNPIPNTPSQQCFIRITDVSDDNTTDKSKTAFTIASPQGIQVLNPNGGENWLVSTTNEIRWTSTNIDSVKIEYSIDGGADWSTIVDRVPSNGSYKWTVPPVQFGSDLCVIKISDSKQKFPSDISDGYFSIQNKSIRILFPNGGEFISQDTLLTWSSTGVSSVNIEYSDDNGIAWNPIVNDYHSTGAYFWRLPFSQPSSLARIRITDATDPTITDMSDSYFYLHIAKGISVQKPDPNYNYVSGSEMNISWKSGINISNVRIEYSYNNGLNWNLIGNNVPTTYKTDNVFIWKNIPKVSNNILIKITDSNGKYSAKSSLVKIY